MLLHIKMVRSLVFLAQFIVFSTCFGDLFLY